MDQLLTQFLFVVFPYFIIAVFLIGLVYRFSRWLMPKSKTGLQNVAIVPGSYGLSHTIIDLVKRIFAFYTVSSPNSGKDKTLVVGSIMFHYGIWVVLIGHVAMVLNLGISPSLHSAIALYVGGVAGFVALGGMLILLGRRIGVPKIMSISYLDDYFAIGLLVSVIGLGLVNTVWLRPDWMGSVAPWLVSILSFRPEIASMAGISILTQIHILLSLIFIGYTPFGKMTHVLSYLFQPTVTGKSYEITVQDSGRQVEEQLS